MAYSHRGELPQPGQQRPMSPSSRTYATVPNGLVARAREAGLDPERVARRGARFADSVRDRERSADRPTDPKNKFPKTAPVTL
jgi:hypothetical protein